MTGGPVVTIRIFPDLEALSRAAAEYVTALAQRVAAERGRFTVALSGGSTPTRLYTLLGSAPFREAIPWTAVHLFWADERCVAPDHDESNYRLVHDTFLAKAPVPSANVHRIRGEEESGRAARAYEEELRGFFGASGAPVFDLIILGAGEDGHTASLFPGSPVLQEQRRIAAPVHLERPKRDRVTLTFPVLNSAAHVLFLAAGRAKAAVLSEVFDRGNALHCPAGLVRPTTGELLWFVDQDARTSAPACPSA